MGKIRLERSGQMMDSKSKEKVLEEVSQKAKEAEINYHGCSRCTLYGLKEHFDFIPQDLIRASMVLAGGCSSSNGSCGAYSGGLLAIGLKYQPPMEDLSPEAQERRLRSREKQFAFRNTFIKEFGSTLCPDIQELKFGRRFNMLDKKDWEEFMNLPGHYEKCAEVVAKGTRLAAEVLLED